MIKYKADRGNKLLHCLFLPEAFFGCHCCGQKRNGSQGAQDGSYCGTGQSAISRKRHYPCSLYSNISNKLISLKPSFTPYPNILKFHYLWWNWQPRVSLLLCAVALQNSGLLVMLRRLDLVLEENSERNCPCHFNISVLRNNVTWDVSDSRKHRHSFLASDIQHVH